jgi:hypothetical protein
MPLVSYQVNIIEEDGTETPIDYVEYDIEILPSTEYSTKEIKEKEI